MIYNTNYKITDCLVLAPKILNNIQYFYGKKWTFGILVPFQDSSKEKLLYLLTSNFLLISHVEKMNKQIMLPYYTISLAVLFFFLTGPCYDDRTKNIKNKKRVEELIIRYLIRKENSLSRKIFSGLNPRIARKMKCSSCKSFNCYIF